MDIVVVVATETIDVLHVVRITPFPPYLINWTVSKNLVAVWKTETSSNVGSIFICNVWYS